MLAKFLILVVSAVAFTLAPSPANAKAVQVEQAEVERPHRNPVLYVEHVQRRWFYVELADGSTWMVTRCRHEDSNNCWWNARTRGNGEGRSFVVIHRRYHLAVRGTVIG